MVILKPTNNLPNFDFRGKNSIGDMKVYMTTKPSIPSPERRAEFVTIAGRDSTYTVTDGTYDDIEISFGVRTYRGTQTYQDALNKLNEWLRLSYLIDDNEIVFSEYPSWVFKVKGIHPYTWEHFPVTGELTTMIRLRCEPFKFSFKDNIVMGGGSGAIKIPPREFPWKYDTKMFRYRNETNLSSKENLTAMMKYNDYVMTRIEPERYYNALTSVDGNSTSAYQLRGSSSNSNDPYTEFNLAPDFYELPFDLFRNDPNQPDNINNGSYAVNAREWNFKGYGMIYESSKRFKLKPGEYYTGAFDTNEKDQSGQLYLQLIDHTTGYGYLLGGGPMFTQNWNQFMLNSGGINELHDCSFRVWFRSDIYYRPGTENISLTDIVLVQGYQATRPRFLPRVTTKAGHQVAVNIAEMARKFEPNIFSGATSEADARARLTQRNMKIDLDFVSRYIGDSATRYAFVRNKDLTWKEIYKATTFGGTDQEFRLSAGNAEISQATYNNDGGVPNLWVVFLMYTDSDFVNPILDRNPRYCNIDMVRPTVTIEAIPQSTATVINTETFTAFPFLKVYPNPSASNAKITFKGTDFAGKPYEQSIEIFNLIQVTGAQYLEIDCEYMDITRVDPGNALNTRQWNNFSRIDKFPVMQSGSNTITISNINKMEFTWRTRKL